MPSIGRKPGRRYITTWQMEPVVLALLAALTPENWEITIQDDRMERINYDHPADLVGITAETYTARRAYQIAAEYRRRGVKVVIGGYHPSLWPDEVEEHADAIVVGPAEGVWKTVLEDAEAGKLQKRYRGSFEFPWRGIFPRREVFTGRNYLPVALVEFSRGCRFHCSFCSITTFSKGKHYFRPPEEVAEEIRRTGQKLVFLIDDNIASNQDAAFQLCKALEPLKISWVSQISVDAAANPKLVKAMAQSGCIGVLIGFETLRPDLLSAVNKKCNGSIELFERALALVRDHHICVYGTFLCGIDGDDKKAFPRTLEFVKKHRFFLAAFNHVIPFPGTPLYSKLKAQGRLTSPAWWLDESFRFGQVPFVPTNMTPQELADLSREYRRKFYSLRSIIKRGLDVKTHLQSRPTFFMFLSQNLYGRREVDEKFGLPLGFQE